MKQALSCTLLFTFILTTPIAANFEALPNLHLVNMTIFRGAQPHPEGLKKLSEMGIRTIINLRGDSPETQEEAKAAKALGFNYYNIPLSALNRPNDERVKQVLELMSNLSNSPVFVHCKNGGDRTGTIIACYRIAREGWSDDQAIAEARKVGLGRFQLGMKSFIRDYYKEYNAQQTAKR